MVTKICSYPEIWKISVGLPENPLKNLNVYVVKDGEEALVVDTGFHRSECKETLLSGIKELHLNLSKTKLFLTHLHSDHIGLANLFADSGSTIYMNGIDYAYFCNVKQGKVWPYMEAMYCKEGLSEDSRKRQEKENQGRRFAPDRVFSAELIEDGSKITVGREKFTCIHTPGHTPGHTVLYHPESKVLFSGDHILFDITPNISVWKDVEGSLKDYLDSLDKIALLPLERVLPAHREESKDAYQRIEEIKKHHEVRLAEIREVIAAAPSGMAASEIAAKIKWSARGRKWEEFPPHQMWFAMGETLAHLRYLCDNGDIERKELSDRIAYCVKNKDKTGKGKSIG